MTRVALMRTGMVLFAFGCGLLTDGNIGRIIKDGIIVKSAEAGGYGGGGQAGVAGSGWGGSGGSAGRQPAGGTYSNDPSTGHLYYTPPGRSPSIQEATDEDGTATSQADNDCHFRRWPDGATHDPPHWRLYSDAAARLHPDDHAWQFRVEVWRRLLPVPRQSLRGGEVLILFLADVYPHPRGMGWARFLPSNSACVYRLAACLLALAGGGTFFLPFFGGLTLPVGSSISPFSLAR